MMKRFCILNEFLKSSSSTGINLMKKFKFNKSLTLSFSTTNSGVKTIDLIKILRAETNSPLNHIKKALEETNNNIDEAKIWLKKKGFKEAENKMSRTANTKLYGLKKNGNKVSVSSLSCETDFVAGTDLFKNYSSIILNILSDNSLAEIKEEDFEKIKVTENKIDNSFDNMSILDGLKSLISKIGENCRILQLKNFEFIPSNENTKSFIGTYLHTSPTNYPNLGIKSSFVVLSAESESDPITEKIENELNELSSQLAMQVVACGPKYLNKSEIPAEVLENEAKIIEERVAKESKPELIKKLVDSALKSWIEERVLNEQNFVIQDHESNEGKINVQSLIAKYEKKLKLKSLQIKDFKLFV